MRKINYLIYGLGFLPAISLAQSTDFQQQLQQSAVLSKELNQNTPHLASINITSQFFYYLPLYFLDITAI